MSSKHFLGDLRHKLSLGSGGARGLSTETAVEGGRDALRRGVELARSKRDRDAGRQLQRALDFGRSCGHAGGPSDPGGSGASSRDSALGTWEARACN